jgi:hypothetical protein
VESVGLSLSVLLLKHKYFHWFHKYSVGLSACSVGLIEPSVPLTECFLSLSKRSVGLISSLYYCS